MTDADLDLYGFRSAASGGILFCGVTDEAFAINGRTYQWPRGMKVSWGIGFSRLGTLSDLDCKGAREQAFAEICGYCGLDAAYNPNSKTANFIAMSTRLDGPNGILAQHRIPVGNVTQETVLPGEFDDGENWSIGANVGAAIDYYRVDLHELLHGCGLGHAPVDKNNPALIEPTYSRSIRNLQPRDIAELQRRYGKRETPVPTPVPTPAPSNKTIIEISGAVSGISIPGYRVTKL